MRNPAKNQYTSVIEGVIQCNDCGGYAESEDQVKHHKSCIPGDSERWRKVHNEEDRP